MACNTLVNIINENCENNSGGIFVAKVFDMADLVTYTHDDTTHEVTALTISASASSFEFRRNTSNFTSDSAIDLINGSTYQTATLNFIFSRREASKSKALRILSEGQRYLGIVIGDANGKYWYFPYAQVTAIGEGSGTARADGSKYSVSFVSEMDTLEYEVPMSIYSAL